MQTALIARPSLALERASYFARVRGTAMQTALIAVLRRPDGLFARVSRRREPFERPRPAGAAEAVSLAGHDPYAEEVIPLRDAPLARQGALALLPTSWDAVGRVTAFDAPTLAHVLNVLVHTLPDPEAVPDLPPLRFKEPPAPPQPTAAHPRAYQGTKTNPPKPQQPASVDLRPNLCVPRDVNRLLLRLAPLVTEAEPVLDRFDLLPGRFPRLLDDEGRPLDPYLQYCHRAGRESLHALPGPFRRGLLFWLRGCPWEGVRRALGLYWGLGLETNPPLLRCVGRLLATCLTPGALDWIELLLPQPPERRAALAELLVETKVAWEPVPPGLPELLEEVGRDTTDARFRHRVDALLRAVRRGEALDYLRAGFRLADEFDPDYDFDDVGVCDGFPLEAVRAFVRHVRRPPEPGEGTRDRYALTLWDCCARAPGFAPLLAADNWGGLEPDVAYEAVERFVRAAYLSPDDEEGLAWWHVLRARAADLFRFARDTGPPYRLKSLRYLGDLFWSHDDPAGLKRALDDCRTFLPRLCRSPFPINSFPDAVTALTTLAPAPWAEAAGAGDACWLKLEQWARRKNDAWLLGDGLGFLAARAGGWTARAFRSCPHYLCKAASVLGGLGQSLQHEVLHAWQAHPLTAAEIEVLPLRELVLSVEANRPAGVYNPVPRKASDFAHGRRELTPAQEERAGRLLRAGLDAARADLLHRLTLDRLARGLGPTDDSEPVRHALRLQGSVTDNRRGLRRFLRAYFGGRRTYLRDHPVNRRWLERRPWLDANLWANGVECCRDVPGYGPVRLSIEREPLEVLRLGTYVGSCLGVGGSMTDSAAAVLLDVNKRVLYARDAKGTVLARQLLTISEGGRLACHAVYPAAAGDELKRAFGDYDRAFAAALRVEVLAPGAEDETALLLSRSWWDDGAWDLR